MTLVPDYIFKIFSNLWQFFSKGGKVLVSSKAFGLVPYGSISFLLLLVRSVMMTRLPRDCHGTATVLTRIRSNSALFILQLGRPEHNLNIVYKFNLGCVCVSAYNT
jgi:hypothetical protein